MRSLSQTGWFVIVTVLCAAAAQGKDIRRSDYKMTVPDESTVDPPEPDIDLDHMTTINLPNQNTMIVLVLDDKKSLDKSFEGMCRNYMSKLKEAESTESPFAKDRKGKAALLKGKLNGIHYCFHVVALAGKEKGFVVVTIYPEREQKELQEILKAALDSFSIKE